MKIQRDSIRAVAAATMAAVIVAWWAPPVAAEAATAFTFPAVTPPNLPITVGGRGYAARQSVRVELDGRMIGTASAGADGKVSTRVRVPWGAQPGRHAVSLVSSAGRVGTTALDVRTDWGQGGFSGWRTSKNPFENTIGPANVGGLRPQWASFLKTRRVNTLGGGLFFTGYSVGVRAYDARTGEPRWERYTGLQAEGLAYVDGVLYFSGSSGLVTLDPNTGATTGAADLPASVSSSGVNVPTLGGGRVYLRGNSGGSAGRLTAFDATTLRRQWVNEERFLEQEPLTYGDGRIFGLGVHSEVEAFDAATGRHQWTSTLGGGRPSYFNDGSGGLLYQADLGEVHALDPATGAMRWQTRVDGTGGQLAISNGLVFALTVGGTEHPGTLYALDLATGAVRWEKYLTSASLSAPIIANQVMYLHEPGVGLVGLNPDTGDRLAVIDPACRGYNIAVADGLLYEDCFDSNGKAITTAYTPLAPG